MKEFFLPFIFLWKTFLLSNGINNATGLHLHEQGPQINLRSNGTNDRSQKKQHNSFTQSKILLGFV